MKKLCFSIISTLLFLFTQAVLGENIRGINIDFVTIGNAGNAADKGGTPGCGAVDYNYKIGKYEITNAQWNIFTSIAGVPKGDDGGYSYNSNFTGLLQPVNRISWYEAAQFCNYLTSGDKSKGAYRFSGNNFNPGSFLGIDRASSISTYGKTYVIPTENEWYKAAYFKPDGSGYLIYAINAVPVPGVNSNYNGALGQTPWNVGTGTEEQNGTFDIMGNVWEWNETFFDGLTHGVRGGSYAGDYNNGPILRSSYWASSNPFSEQKDYGFRIAEIPEPATILLFSLGGLMFRKYIYG